MNSSVIRSRVVHIPQISWKSTCNVFGCSANKQTDKRESIHYVRWLGFGKSSIQLECWQLTWQFPTWQSPVCTSSDRRNYESRHSDQQTKGLTENKSSFIRKPHVVISRQSPFAANIATKLVATATSLRPSISAMSSLDSLTPKTYP